MLLFRLLTSDSRLLQLLHLFLEDAPAVLVALEHVKAGASGREQNRVAGLGRTVSLVNRVGHVRGAERRRETFKLRLDAVCVLAYEDERASLPLDERRERRVGRVLAATAEDEDDAARLLDVEIIWAGREAAPEGVSSGGDG